MNYLYILTATHQGSFLTIWSMTNPSFAGEKSILQYAYGLLTFPSPFSLKPAVEIPGSTTTNPATLSPHFDTCRQ